MNRKIAIGLSAAVAAAAIAVPVIISNSGSPDARTTAGSVPGSKAEIKPELASDVTSTPEPPASSSTWTSLGFGEASEVEHYSDVSTMAKNATVVVQASVERSYPTRLVGNEGAKGDSGVQYYGLELKVDRVLAGNLWNESDTQGRTVVETFGRLKDDAPPLEGIFFLVHKSDRVVPGQPPAGKDSALPGDEKYYRFISSQGLLTEAADGNPLFPLSGPDSTKNVEILKSVAGKTFDEVVAGIS